MTSALPHPAAEARAVSDSLLVEIRRQIDQFSGCLPFDVFMRAALYEPGLGYYSNGLIPFGAQGDFITAPESGSVFGRCLARSISTVLAQCDQADVLELGAGSGALAVDLLRELAQLDAAMPRHYYILERSAAMRALQEDAVKHLPAHVRARVSWLDELPAQRLRGVVLGNEVADALPVKRFRWSAGHVDELGAGYDGKRLIECVRPSGDELRDYVGRLAQDHAWQADYQSEYCPTLQPLVRSLSDCIEQGLLLLIDYGYGRAEYYHSQRAMGTLMCHYRHQAHGDPFHYPGLQDITAFVDFTAIAEAADAEGMQLQGFSSQAQFLIGCGIDELLAELAPSDTRRFLERSNEIKRLVLPGEMGDRFKVMGFSRGLPQQVRGFSTQDLRSRL
jgi:SAM-dependent MidA family methyltransferase